MRATLPLALVLAGTLAAPAYAAEASGRVVDDATGAPIEGVFVRPLGASASTFTDREGRFVLKTSGRTAVELSASGYQLKQLESWDAGPIRLVPVASYAPAPAAIAAPAAVSRAVEATVHLDYQIQRLAHAAGAGPTLDGFATDALRLGALAQLGPWQAEGDLGRLRVPVEVQGLSAQENPAFSPEHWEARALAGHRFRWGAFSATPAIAYRYWRYDPQNGGVPYANSALDFRQNEHAIGPAVTAEAELPFGLRLGGDARLYPLVAGLSDPGDPVLATRFGMQAELTLGYPLAAGFAPTFGYRFEGWRGDDFDRTAHVVFARVGFDAR